jgi:hypothetical protein
VLNRLGSAYYMDYLMTAECCYCVEAYITGVCCEGMHSCGTVAQSLKLAIWYSAYSTDHLLTCNAGVAGEAQYNETELLRTKDFE